MPPGQPTARLPRCFATSRRAESQQSMWGFKRARHDLRADEPPRSLCIATDAPEDSETSPEDRTDNPRSNAGRRIADRRRAVAASDKGGRRRNASPLRDGFRASHTVAALKKRSAKSPGCGLSRRPADALRLERRSQTFGQIAEACLARGYRYCSVTDPFYWSSHRTRPVDGRLKKHRRRSMRLTARTMAGSDHQGIEANIPPTDRWT